MTQAMDFVLSLILRLIGVVMAAVGLIDAFLRGLMTRAGVGGQVQAVVLGVVAVLFILAALRVFGGVLRVLIIIFLVLLLIHVLMPGFQVPAGMHV